MISWAKACMTQYMFKTRAFTRMKPNIEHFRLFGCPMYFHVPKEKKSKLDTLERKNTVNFQRHSRSTSLVRDRLRQVETLSLKKRYIYIVSNSLVEETKPTIVHLQDFCEWFRSFSLCLHMIRIVLQIAFGIAFKLILVA